MGASGVVAVAIVMGVLLDGLELDGFFVGDSGVKYTAAQNAISHPARPLDIPIARVGLESAADFMEPFWTRHGDHAHASTPPLFPLLTAPLIAVLGLHGAYLLPLVSFIVLIPATVALGRATEVHAGPIMVGAASVLLTPMLFYGLEYWEHSTAVACGALAATLVLRRGQSTFSLWLAGVLGGVAFLLRPEAVWMILAIVLSVGVVRGSWKRAAWFGVVVVLTVGPQFTYNIVHFGDLWGTHLGNNLLQLDRQWAISRIDIVEMWLLSFSRRDSLWRVFPFALVAFIYPRSDGPRKALWLMVAIPVLGGLLTSPNTGGGGQWGPRYVLMVVPMLLLLALDASGRLWSRTGRLQYRVAVAVLLAISVSSGVWATRAGYRELRGSKRGSAEIARTIAGLECSHVVTSLWWLDQLAATAPGHRTFLFAPTSQRAREALELLARHGVGSVALVSSPEEAPLEVDGILGVYRRLHQLRTVSRHLVIEVLTKGPDGTGISQSSVPHDLSVGAGEYPEPAIPGSR